MIPNVAILLFSGLPGIALACGACLEDKVAATYDHHVVTSALAQKHVVVFAAVEGSGSAKALVGAAKKAASRIGGIDASSVRAAHEPAPALAFAIDPGKQTPQRALLAIEQSVNGKPMKLTLLRVVQ
jgi:hypothetical protein